MSSSIHSFKAPVECLVCTRCLFNLRSLCFRKGKLPANIKNIFIVQDLFLKKNKRGKQLILGMLSKQPNLVQFYFSTNSWSSLTGLAFCQLFLPSLQCSPLIPVPLAGKLAVLAKGHPYCRLLEFIAPNLGEFPLMGSIFIKSFLLFGAAVI